MGQRIGLLLLSRVRSLEHRVPRSTVRHRRETGRQILFGVLRSWGENVGCRLSGICTLLAEIRITRELEAFAQVHAACYDTSDIANVEFAELHVLTEKMEEFD